MAELLTIPTAATLAKASKRSIQRAVKRGEIKVQRLPRVAVDPQSWATWAIKHNRRKK